MFMNWLFSTWSWLLPSSFIAQLKSYVYLCISLCQYEILVLDWFFIYRILKMVDQFEWRRKNSRTIINIFVHLNRIGFCIDINRIQRSWRYMKCKIFSITAPSNKFLSFQSHAMYITHDTKKNDSAKILRRDYLFSGSNKYAVKRKKLKLR